MNLIASGFARASNRTWHASQRASLHCGGDGQRADFGFACRVLAVLMVQKKTDKEPRFYKGINCEVSMPTGTLCAERNAIGCALASDPTLMRRDLKMIAVMTLSLDSKPSSPPNQPSMPSAMVRAPPEAPSERPPFLRAQSEQALMSSPQRAAAAALGRIGVEAGKDLNPINPCGACNEWLKKIAEVNPDFKVLTFTSAACSEVFAKPVS